MIDLLHTTKTRLYASFLLFSSALLLLTGCSSERQITKFSGSTMGTTYHISVSSDRAIEVGSLKTQVDELLLSINDSMSTYIENSELNRFNRHPVAEVFDVSAELCSVFSQAGEVYRLSAGAFDPTVGRLIDLWGFGSGSTLNSSSNSNQIPEKAIIAEILQLVDFRAIDIDCVNRQLTKYKNVQVDLSAIAKGYGVDRVAELLKSAGYPHFLVEIGGEIFVSGNKLASTSWAIAIEKPSTGSSLATPPQVQEVLRLSEIGMATSGDYRNYFEQNGVRYSHTINPLDGSPIRHHLASVTVLHESVAMADALATALMVMGPEKGVALTVEKDIAAYFIVKEGEAFTSVATPAFEQLTISGSEL